MIESTLLPDVHPQAAQTFPVINPASGEHLADVPEVGAAGTTAAIEKATRALRHEPGLQKRRDWLGSIVRLLAENRSELARIITLEQGKPLIESLTEVDYASGFFRVCQED